MKTATINPKDLALNWLKEIFGEIQNYKCCEIRSRLSSAKIYFDSKTIFWQGYYRYDHVNDLLLLSVKNIRRSIIREIAVKNGQIKFDKFFTIDGKKRRFNG